MAADINSVTLTGRLTRDSELKYMQSGNAQVRFSIAVGRSKRNADGSWGTETSYFDCVYYGKPAEGVNSFLQKGRQVALTGELRQDRWEGQDGQARTRVEIYVSSLLLLAPPKGAGDTAVADQIIAQSRGNGYSQNNNNGGYQNSYQQSGNGAYSQNSNGGSYGGGSYNNSSNQGYSKAPAQPRPSVSGGPEDFQDDDIPF